MDTDERFQVSSKDGMTMIVSQRTVIGEGTPERADSHTVTIIDRRGKVFRDKLEIPVNNKAEYEWLVELHELLESVVQKLRGW